MQQHLPQAAMTSFPVKNENLQDSYYQQQVQQPPIAPISPPLATSVPVQAAPTSRSPPIGKSSFFPVKIGGKIHGGKIQDI